MAGCYFAAAAVARAMAALRALAAAAAAAEICPFCGAIAWASAEGRPLYFLPVLRTAPGPPGSEVFRKHGGAAFPRHTAGRIPGPQVFMHDIKELLELERCTAGEHRNQFFGHKIRNSTGKCVFLENSHRAAMIPHPGSFAADFSEWSFPRFYTLNIRCL